MLIDCRKRSDNKVWVEFCCFQLYSEDIEKKQCLSSIWEVWFYWYAFWTLSLKTSGTFHRLMDKYILFVRYLNFTLLRSKIFWNLKKCRSNFKLSEKIFTSFLKSCLFSLFYKWEIQMSNPIVTSWRVQIILKRVRFLPSYLLVKIQLGYFHSTYDTK